MHFFELHFLILGGLVCVYVFFTFAFTRKSRRLRGRLYAMNGFSEKLKSKMAAIDGSLAHKIRLHCRLGISSLAHYYKLFGNTTSGSMFVVCAISTVY